MDIPTILTGDYEPFYQQQLNEALRYLLSIDGWKIPALTNAQVTQVTSYEFVPVLPVFTLWGNSDLGKLQFITVAADPDTTTNASYETVTST